MPVLRSYEFPLETSDGIMPTFVTRPTAEGAYPPIIFYMDAPGIREELRNMAHYIAAQGYIVLLPDLFYRVGKLRFDREGLQRGPQFLAVMKAARDSISNAAIMDDTRALLATIDSIPQAKDGLVGCVGYCMSGRFVVTAMGTFPDRLAAGASLYGVQIVTGEEDSPHRLADRIKGELYFGFAEEDSYVPDNVIPDLKTALDAHNVTYTLKVFPKTTHGFCFAERSQYHEASALQVWRDMFELYDRTLR